MVDEKLLKDCTLEEISEAAKEWVSDRKQDFEENLLGRSLNEQITLMALTRANAEDISRLFAFLEAIIAKLLTKEN